MNRFRQIQAENAELCEVKNKLYGDRSLTRFGAAGIVTRMYDKMERLARMVVDNRKPGRKARAVTDSIKDAFRDMANYATIGQMFAEGTFIGVSDTADEVLRVLFPEPKGRSKEEPARTQTNGKMKSSRRSRR